MTLFWIMSSFTWDKWTNLCVAPPLLMFDLMLWYTFADFVSKNNLFPKKVKTMEPGFVCENCKNHIMEAVVTAEDPEYTCLVVKKCHSCGKEEATAVHQFPPEPTDQCEFTLKCERCGFEQTFDRHNYAYWYDTTANRYCTRCEEPGLH